jgi:hypothetical protein
MIFICFVLTGNLVPPWENNIDGGWGYLNLWERKQEHEWETCMLIRFIMCTGDEMKDDDTNTIELDT